MSATTPTCTCGRGCHERVRSLEEQLEALARWADSAAEMVDRRMQHDYRSLQHSDECEVCALLASNPASERVEVPAQDISGLLREHPDGSPAHFPEGPWEAYPGEESNQEREP